MQLSGKSIILGISGSIAAYKSLDLIRLLHAQGARVRAIATPQALDFVTQLSLDTLTTQAPSSGIAHIESAYETDLMLMTPATANLIAKMAHGISDNLLLQTYLSYRGPVLLTPAMETKMWEHPATQSNIEILKQRGVQIINPESGDLASGRQGIGRLADLELILEHVFASFYKQDFVGKHVLITAGPTIEELDPVRYLSNYSSGKMGVALTRALAHRGAQVSLIHGPLQVPIPKLSNITGYAIKSARDMLAYALELAPKSDLAILCAAVADFRPAGYSKEKIKKNNPHPNPLPKGEGNYSIELVENPDILKILGEQKKRPFLVGFAAETSNLEQNALEKCRVKNCDLICANWAQFGSDTHGITIVNQNKVVKQIEPVSKYTLAHLIVSECLKYFFFSEDQTSISPVPISKNQA